MGLSPRAVQQLIETLEDAGPVRYAEEGRKRGYTLSRPADQIGVHELLQASEDLLPPVLGARSQKDPAWRLVRQFHQAGEEMAKAKTLADLCK